MAKRFLTTSLLFFLITGLCFANAQKQTDSIPGRKKVAVVLSGGGAKGMAHIGVLKVLKKIGIPIDYYVGTSMGSIIGGLSAIGYTPEQLDSMVRIQDWGMLLSDKTPRSEQNMEERENNEKYIISTKLGKDMARNFSGGLIKAQNISNLFSELTIGYHDPNDFNQFPIPFACVACDITTGKEVVFHDGYLPQAMRASMAIPGIFTPVRLGSQVLVDGGVINNYPTDVAKEMGADIIIGIDVQSKLHEASELKSTGSIIGQLVNLMGQDKYTNNIGLTDLYIKVNVDGYSSASFSAEAIDTLINRGEQAANLKLDELSKLKDSLNLYKNKSEKVIPVYPYSPERKIYIRNIILNGVNTDNIKWVLKRCNLKDNSITDIKTINNSINILCANIGFAGATFTLPKAYDKGYDLVIDLQRKHTNKLNLGVRFDSEDIASILINISNELNTKTPSRLSLTAKLGKNYGADISYSLEPAPLKRFNFIGQYLSNSLYYYYNGKKTHNVDLKYYKGEISFSDIWIRNFKFTTGLKYEYYNYNDPLYSYNSHNFDIRDEHFFTYFTRLNLDSFDKAYFPNNGVSSNLSFSVYTDNLSKYKDERPFSALQGSFESVIKVSNRFRILPRIAGRVLFGSNVAYSKMNVMGGDIFGKYLPQELPFIGIRNNEIVDNTLFIGGLKFRQRMGDKHYISLATNYAISSDHIRNIFNGYKTFGYGIGYGMDSMFGPIEASLNFSSKGDDMGLYVNLGFKF